MDTLLDTWNWSAGTSRYCHRITTHITVLCRLYYYILTIPSDQTAGRPSITSNSNSNTGGSRLIFSVPLSYFLFIFYLPWCTLIDFHSVSFLVSLPFLFCCYRTTTTTIPSQAKTFSINFILLLDNIKSIFWSIGFILFCLYRSWSFNSILSEIFLHYRIEFGFCIKNEYATV